MLTHPKSSMHILCMLTYLSLGHVTLLLNFFTRWTYGAGRPHVGLCPIFLVSLYYVTKCGYSELCNCNKWSIYHLL